MTVLLLNWRQLTGRSIGDLQRLYCNTNVKEALIKSRDVRCVRCRWMQGVALKPR